MANPASDPRIGTVLQGRYRILEKIATGAMGAIYRAERLKLGRAVAIKFLDVSFTAEAKELLQRFEREAQAMSRLGHPHCVSVMDFGVADAPYIVMEYVTGTTLEQLISWGRVAPARAIPILRQILAGLAHAHRQDIIHRDIKPANIMLTEATGTGDHARILDFGLAKLVDVTPRDISTSKVVVGTPSYMSPEQSMGQPVDARSDLYSVAVVAFELLTGKKPFANPDKLETLRMHREEPPPYLTDIAPDLGLSDELEDVISRALAKSPADRFATAIDFAEALDAVPEAKRAGRFLLETEASERTLPVPRGRRTRPLLLVGLVVVLAAAGLWQFWLGPDRTRATGDTASPRRLAAIPPDPSLTAGAPPVGEAGADPNPATRLDGGPGDGGPGDAGQGVGDGGLGDGGLGDDGDGGLGDGSFDEDELVDIEIGDPDQGEGGDGPAGAEGVGAAGPVRTLDDARALIAAGHRDEAIAGLRQLARRQPKSSTIPYLLGNLYLDKRWTGPAMESYRTAIANNPAYRRNPTLIRRAIDSLESSTASKQASTLLLRSIGKPALPQLEKAADRHRSRTVRRRAAWLVAQLSGKKKP